ncbi:MAG TPA: hypothetical protein VN711_03100 [Candidatus Saccharimonadales bacterium]|nr:hypothetical protein [Candidatus Saccharimonadales bacterium]
MRKLWLFYNSTVILLTIAVCLGFWIWSPLIFGQNTALSFPVPTSFALPWNNQVSTLDIWAPTQNVQNTTGPQQPEISGLSALSYDLDTNTYLYAKDIHTKLPMASLTKIMTAIVALEHPKTNDKYLVTQEDIVGNDMMGLSPGEVLSKEELLYGLVLPSGNDAAETFASNYDGGLSHFVYGMNQKAKSLGLNATHFTNPSGLEGDGHQYTTAYDLLVITHYALSHFPLFKTVVATYQESIPSTPTHKAYDLTNETNLLTSYPGVAGVKDGYTPEAGLCLVTYLDYKGHHILAVLLGSDDRRGEMKEILDYSLRQIGVTPPPHD